MCDTGCVLCWCVNLGGLHSQQDRQECTHGGAMCRTGHTVIPHFSLHSQVKIKEEKIAGSDTVLLSCEGIGLKKRVHA